jgi:hypothetical protein
VSVGGDLHIEALVTQSQRDEVANALLIVHDEDPRWLCHLPSI